jgi:hypothetical protein
VQGVCTCRTLANECQCNTMPIDIQRETILDQGTDWRRPWSEDSLRAANSLHRLASVKRSILMGLFLHLPSTLAGQSRRQPSYAQIWRPCKSRIIDKVVSDLSRNMGVMVCVSVWRIQEYRKGPF